jgi:hypothetical protein
MSLCNGKQRRVPLEWLAVVAVMTAIMSTATVTAERHVASGPCLSDPPHVHSKKCNDAIDEGLFFCGFDSDWDEMGRVYICMGGQWLYFSDFSLRKNSDNKEL